VQVEWHSPCTLQTTVHGHAVLTTPNRKGSIYPIPGDTLGNHLNRSMGTAVRTKNISNVQRSLDVSLQNDMFLL
jgi:hypothetical protein